jgi:ubiquinone/menaquinone biosynthesis C-methylase UbiE
MNNNRDRWRISAVPSLGSKLFKKERFKVQHTMNKSELLQKIRASRQRLETVLAQIDDEHMLTPALPGGWSVKDLLAHLGWWEWYMVKVYDLLQRGENPPYPLQLDDPAVNEVNARAWAESHQRPLADTRRDESAAYHALLSLVETLSEAELFDPHRFAWTAGRPLADPFIFNTWGHYEEHWRDLLTWLWQLAERQPFIGWDFSYLADKWIEEDLPWSYEGLVRELMPAAKSVLDLGTGGGEKLLSFKDVFPPRVAATEGYPPNLRLARERLGPLGVEVRESENSLTEILPFDDETFDLVIDRHSGFNSADIERVLKPGGVFLTQQVDGRNLSDLSDMFECQQPWTFFTLDFALAEIKKTKLVVEMAQEWTGRSIFKDVAAIVYYLKAIPWIVEGFAVDTHLPYLFKLQERLEQEGELVFTQKRMIVKARKP